MRVQNSTRFLVQGTGQAPNFPGMAWGNGFVTDKPTVRAGSTPAAGAPGSAGVPAGLWVAEEHGTCSCLHPLLVTSGAQPDSDPINRGVACFAFEKQCPALRQIAAYNISDASGFFDNITASPGLAERVILAPHVYGPNVTVRHPALFS